MTAPAAPVIVVGVDGSTGSRDAVRWAAGAGPADRRGTEGGGHLAVAELRHPDPARRRPRSRHASTLQEVIAEIRTEFPEVPVSEHVVEGPGGPALLSQAADATLLVVGARGRAAYPGMLLGSVAEYCVRNGPCPVVVVRRPAP